MVSSGDGSLGCRWCQQASYLPFRQGLGQGFAAFRQIDGSKWILPGQVLPDQKVEKRFQRGNAPGIGAPRDFAGCAVLQEKGMDRRRVDVAEAPDFFGDTTGKKEIDVGRIGRDAVLGQSPLGDEIAKVQLESCGELLWK
jgi:hypothetical protein